MSFGVTFWYYSQKSTSSRFKVLLDSCLTAGGHAASFINQVCIILVNSLMIPDGIMNGVGLEARACAFLCFRACNTIVCSSGVHSLPFSAENVCVSSGGNTHGPTVIKYSRGMLSLDIPSSSCPATKYLLRPFFSLVYFIHIPDCIIKEQITMILYI